MYDPVYVEREDDRIAVTSGFRDRDMVKMVPGAKWDRQRRQWFTRLSWNACVQLRSVFGERLDIGPALADWATAERDRVDRCMALRLARDTTWHSDNLYPLQRVAVQFIAEARQVLLGDEMGAGKTRETIGALEMNDAYPALVVTVKGGKHSSWADEFKRVAPHRKVVVVEGPAKKRREQITSGADVLIMNWEQLRVHSRLAGYGNLKLDDKEKEPKELNDPGLEFKSMVVDEAHRMADPRSKQTRAAWWLRGQLPADGMAVAATGTPLTNTLENLWPIMHWVAPDEWPSKTAFIDRYALQTWSPFGFTQVSGVLPQMKDEFFSLLDPRFIRRPQKVVVPAYKEPIILPPRCIEMGSKQKKAYKDMKTNLLTQVEGGVIMVKNPLLQMVRLRQLAAAYAEIEFSDPDPETGHVSVELDLINPSAVVDGLLELYEGELSDKQTIFFSESRKLMELAAARLASKDISHGLITGQVKDAIRESNRIGFQNGQIQHLGLTMGAGGESLTLTAADAVVYIERSFSLIRNQQSLFRAVRPGQDTNVMVIDIVPILGYDKNGEEIHTVYKTARDAVVLKGMNLEEVVRDRGTLAHFLETGQA